MKHEDNRPEMEKEISMWRSEAEEPHYAFVQFLTGLNAGMLGLLAPQQNNYASVNLLAEWSGLLSLACLAAALIFGVTALYGRKNTRNQRANLLQRIYHKHKEADVPACEEARELPEPKAPAIHRIAFRAQVTYSLLAILLLLLSRASLLSQ